MKVILCFIKRKCYSKDMLLFIVLILSLYSIYRSNIEYENCIIAKDAYNQAKDRYNEVIYNNNQKNLIKLNTSNLDINQAKMFSDFEASILNKVQTDISIFSTCVAILAIIVALATLYNIYNQYEINKKMNDWDKKYEWVNIIPYLSLGNYNKLLKESLYALNDYNTAYYIDPKNIFINYFLGVHYADVYAEIPDKEKNTNEQILKNAKKHIVQAINILNEDSGSYTELNLKKALIKSELYTTLGGIYGLYGKIYFNKEKNKMAIEKFEESVKMLKEAEKASEEKVELCELKNNDSEIYANLGISYAYLVKCGKGSYRGKVYDSFINALDADSEQLIRKYYIKKDDNGKTIINVPWNDLSKDEKFACFSDEFARLEKNDYFKENKDG